ncbi:Netrin receptor unc5c [Porites harrisoni]
MKTFYAVLSKVHGAAEQMAKIEMDTDVVQESEVQISGCYKITSGTPAFHPTRIEHSCLMTPENKWEIQVKCRPLLHDTQEEPKQSNNWRSLVLVYPDAKVQLMHNDIEVTLPPLQEDVEIAAFGRPGKEDKKRMQMAIFAKRPKQGRDWQIRVYLVDDTNPACKKICQKGDQSGKRLLTPLSGIFVSNSNDDIKIELNSLEDGWKVKGSNVKTIKSRDAWNSTESSTDFPRCYFDICHVNNANNSFFCEIKTSHEGDSAHAEVVAYFERETGLELVQSSADVDKLGNSCNVFSKEIDTSIPLFLFFLSLLYDPPASRPTFPAETTATRQNFTTMKFVSREALWTIVLISSGKKIFV